MTKRQAKILSIVILLSSWVVAARELWPEKIISESVVLSAAPAKVSEPDPVQLSVPSLKINTSFVPLGLTATREIEVPKDPSTVGWYKYGAKPGAVGPVVIVGHLDDQRGRPSVFWNLRDIKLGDRVVIKRQDGTDAIYEVTEKAEYAQDQFPTEKVYGTIDHAGIRLITCSGKYSAIKQRYSKNLIVFGKLVN